MSIYDCMQDRVRRGYIDESVARMVVGSFSVSSEPEKAPSTTDAALLTPVNVRPVPVETSPQAVQDEQRWNAELEQLRKLVVRANSRLERLAREMSLRKLRAYTRQQFLDAAEKNERYTG